MAKVLLAVSANGKRIYYDDESSHAATHLAATPQLLPVLKEFLATQSFDAEETALDHDAGQIIGNTDLCRVTDADEIIYAKRPNRDTYTKFVKGRSPMPTSVFSVVVRKNTSGEYELFSAWVGRLAPPFPDSDEANSESKPFWDNHALVYGTQTIQSGTETSVQPW